MKSSPWFILLGVISAIACSRDELALKKLDLQPHGIPITIMAPDSVEIREKDYAVMRDITIQKNGIYSIQIFEFMTETRDAAGEKLRQLGAVREDPFFREIIREDDHGFIFSKQSDSTMIDYDFRHVKILDGKELIFQTGLIGTFSLKDVKRMYKAVK